MPRSGSLSIKPRPSKRLSCPVGEAQNKGPAIVQLLEQLVGRVRQRNHPVADAFQQRPRLHPKTASFEKIQGMFQIVEVVGIQIAPQAFRYQPRGESAFGADEPSA